MVMGKRRKSHAWGFMAGIHFSATGAGLFHIFIEEALGNYKT
jgi:hypothetical protein